MQRSLSFGRVAEEYERYRPGYPDELLELIITTAGDRPGRAIEIGAGTGKATRLFAAAGISVAAVEPDQAMARVLRRRCAGLPVHVIEGSFEDLVVDDHGVVDLLYAAAAMHWTDPATRWDRVAALLRPGGLFASFGGPSELDDPELAAAEAEITRAALAEVGPPGPTSAVDGMAWPGHELIADGRFSDVTEQVLPRRQDYDRAGYIGLLSTISAYQHLPTEARREMFAALAERFPDRLVVRADIVVHTARRR